MQLHYFFKMNRMKRLVTVFLFACLLGVVQAQQPFVPDTSYNPGSALRKELKTYPFITLAAPNPDAQTKQIRNLEYHNTGTRALQLDLFIPKTSPIPAPIVLLIHGGGWSSGNKEMTHPMATALCNAGFLCASVQYRLSPEAPYPAAVADLKQAIAWMRAHATSYNGNPNQIAVLGCSAGAQLSTLMGTTHQKPFYTTETDTRNGQFAVQAIVNLDGVLAFIHPLSAEGADKPGKPSAATRWLGLHNSQNPQPWIEASPLTHADSLTPPTLFINSQHPRFHAGRDEYLQILQSHGTYTRVYTLPNTPHTFWLFNPWFDPTTRYIEEFLRTVFK